MIKARNSKMHGLQIGFEAVGDQQIDCMVDAPCVGEAAWVVVLPIQGRGQVASDDDLMAAGMGLNVHQHESYHPLAIGLVATTRQELMQQ